MSITVTPPKLSFDGSREQSFTLAIKKSIVRCSGSEGQFVRLFRSFFKASHNLPGCFKLEGYQEMMRSPGKVTVTHTPCSNDCFSEWLFLQFGDVKVPVERLELRSSNIDQMTSLECKICVRQFSEEIGGLTPRILTSCGHTVCEDCAKRLLRGFDITCPFDRKITTVTNTGISYLQKNFTLLEVLQERKIQQMPEHSSKKHEEKVEVPCFENPNHEAIYYCEQCEAEFCKKCFKQVHNPRIFSRHRKVPVSEKPIKLPKCVKHPYNSAEFICKHPNCEYSSDLMCHTCILSKEHDGHEYGVLMESLIENEIALKILLENLEQSTRKLKTRVAKTYECAQSFEVNGPVFNGIIQQINREFEAKKQQALEDLTDFSNCLKKLTEEKQENFEDELDNAKVLKTEIQGKLRAKSDLRNVKDILENGRAMCVSVEASEGEDVLKLNEYTFKLSEQMTLMIDSEQ
ncbi:unnamed protein product [Caenorhabditis brenneri]